MGWSNRRDFSKRIESWQKLDKRCLDLSFPLFLDDVLSRFFSHHSLQVRESQQEVERLRSELASSADSNRLDHFLGFAF